MSSSVPVTVTLGRECVLSSDMDVSSLIPVVTSCVLSAVCALSINSNSFYYPCTLEACNLVGTVTHSFGAILNSKKFTSSLFNINKQCSSVHTPLVRYFSEIR